jgi:RimJ/RimL family protein N-acetyltransferase
MLRERLGQARDPDMQIQLRRIERADLPYIVDWVDSYELMVQWSGPLHFQFPLDEWQLEQFFLAENQEHRPTRMQFTAVEVESQVIVGQIGFVHVWEKIETARLGTVLVAPDYRNRGIGTRMVHSLLHIGFGRLRLHRIELNVFDRNKSAIRCYERAGFQREGLSRDVVCVNGKYWNLIPMSILEKEWLARQPEKT